MRHKDVNVLYNGAGWVHQGMLGTTELEDWQRSFDINVTPMFVLTKAFLPAFIKQGGASIINVASVASSLKGVTNRVGYMSSKAAVIGFTKSVAFDYMKDGIRANALCPGSVDSPSLHDRARALGDHDEVWKTFIARQPIGRMAQPDEMAHICVYLASDESRLRHRRQLHRRRRHHDVRRRGPHQHPRVVEEQMTITRIDPGKRFSAAVRHNDTLYIAGQTADTLTGSVEVQTREVLAKIDDLLKKGGSSKAKLLSINVYLSNIADFAEMNKVYDAWIDTANLATRATVEARLASPDLRVEMTAVAAVD